MNKITILSMLITHPSIVFEFSADQNPILSIGMLEVNRNPCLPLVFHIILLNLTNFIRYIQGGGQTKALQRGRTAQ